MADRITVGVAPEEGVEVELWGALYTTRPITRSVQAAAEKVQQKIEAAKTSDTTVGLIGDLIGLLLVPSNGAAPAADLLREKWKADEISVSQLAQLSEDIQEAGSGPS